MMALVSLCGFFLMTNSIAANTVTNNTLQKNSVQKNITSSQPKALDKIVAIANDDVITQSQLDSAFIQAKQQVAAQKINIAPNELKQQVLNQLILQSLQLQMAKRAKITADDNEVNNAIQNILKENNLTLNQLEQKLEQQGISFNSLKDNLRKQIIITKLQQVAVGQTINISNSDVQKFKQQYSQQTNAQVSYHLDTIVAPLSGGMDKAKALLKLLQQKQNLQVAAAKIYGATMSLEEDDLGWRTQDELPDVFQNMTVNMKVNTYAGPVQAPNGFHILHLIGKKTSGQKLTDIQIKEMVYQQQFNKKLIPWLKQLKSSAYVKVM